MQLDITGHHMDVTEAIKKYVQNKMEKIKNHFDHMNNNVHVVLTVEKSQQKAEGILRVDGSDIFANCIKDDMYEAIDGLANKLDKQILKHKEKLKTQRHR